MKTIGEILREKREEKKYTIKEISSFTNISPNYIKAIENNEFSVLPSDTYVIGFIRNYAEFLGLNKEELVQSYKDYMRYEQDVPFEILTKKEPAINFRLLIKLIFAILLIGAIIAIIFTQNPIRSYIKSLFENNNETKNEKVLDNNSDEVKKYNTDDNSVDVDILNNDTITDDFEESVIDIENIIYETLYSMDEANIQIVIKMNREYENYVISYSIDNEELTQKVLKINENLKLRGNERIILKVSDGNAIDIGIKNNKNEKIILGKKFFNNMAGQIAYYEFLYNKNTSDIIINEKGMNIEQIVIPPISNQ